MPPEPPLPPYSPPKTYLIIGASRGIGLEFCRQLLAQNQRVFATARKATGSSQLWALTGTPNGSNLSILECDIADEESVSRFVVALTVELGRVGRMEGGRWGEGVGQTAGIDVCIVNAGVLVYPNRIMEITYSQFSHHLTTNTIGPLLLAASLLRLSSSPPSPPPSSLSSPNTLSPASQSFPLIPPPQPSTITTSNPTSSPSPPPLPIHTLAFLSSDSSSATRFLPHEDGFGAYAASKSALNQGLRHLAAELSRLPAGTPARDTVVLALHPGEVATEMADGVVAGWGAQGGPQPWEVEGIITPEESVRGLLEVVSVKGKGGWEERGGERVGVATFWDWRGRRHPW